MRQETEVLEACSTHLAPISRQSEGGGTVNCSRLPLERSARGCDERGHNDSGRRHGGSGALEILAVTGGRRGRALVIAAGRGRVILARGRVGRVGSGPRDPLAGRQVRARAELGARVGLVLQARTSGQSTSKSFRGERRSVVELVAGQPLWLR